MTPDRFFRTHRRFIGHRDVPWRLAISPDGRYLVSGDMQGIVILWNLETGEELYRTIHPATIGCVSFSPDGQTAFSSSLAGDIRQWQIADWPLDDLLAWIPDNRYIREFTCEERERYRIEPLCE